MGKAGLFDLERHFAFYGAYHSNPTNILIHVLFVWPIFFTSLLLLYFTPSFFNLPQIGFLPDGFNRVLLLNFGSLFAFVYAMFYVLLDKKAGCLAALLCFGCWVGSSFLASYLGFSLAWKVNIIVILYQGTLYWLTGVLVAVQVVLAAQLFCWTAQFIGHGVFEKRAPALLDNLAQALLFAPLFVFFEILQTSFGYEPYPGFNANVKTKIGAEIKEWRDKKQKKIS